MDEDKKTNANERKEVNPFFHHTNNIDNNKSINDSGNNLNINRNNNNNSNSINSFNNSSIKTPNNSNINNNNNISNELGKRKNNSFNNPLNNNIDNKSSIESNKKKEKRSILKRKDSEGLRKKSGVKESTGLRRASSNLSNMGDLDSKNTEEEQAGQDALNSLATIGDKALTTAKSGFKKIWVAMPTTLKIALIAVIGLLIFVIFLMMLILGLDANSVDYSSSSIRSIKVTNGKVEKDLNDFIKGSIYGTYDNEDDDFIKALTVLVKSIIYTEYDEDEVFDHREVLDILKYNEKYDEFSAIIDMITSDEDADISSNTLGLSYEDGKLVDKNNEEVNYSFINAVDEVSSLYIEDVVDLDKAVIDKMISLSKSGKSYTEILDEIVGTGVDINNLDDVVDGGSLSCKLTGGKTYSIPLRGGANCPANNEPGKCQCAAGVHNYMTTTLLTDKPDILSKFWSFRARYVGYGVNSNSMDADSYYYGGMDGAIFKASKDPAPGDIWARRPEGRGDYGHVFVVLEVKKPNTILVFECNQYGDERCRIHDRQINDPYVQKGIFIHVLGGCE